MCHAVDHRIHLADLVGSERQDIVTLLVQRLLAGLMLADRNHGDPGSAGSFARSAIVQGRAGSVIYLPDRFHKPVVVQNTELSSGGTWARRALEGAWRTI